MMAGDFAAATKDLAQIERLLPSLAASAEPSRRELSHAVSARRLRVAFGTCSADGASQTWDWLAAFLGEDAARVEPEAPHPMVQIELLLLLGEHALLVDEFLNDSELQAALRDAGRDTASMAHADPDQRARLYELIAVGAAGEPPVALGAYMELVHLYGQLVAKGPYVSSLRYAVAAAIACDDPSIAALTSQLEATGDGSRETALVLAVARGVLASVVGPEATR